MGTKITKNMLRKLIKEELNKVLTEGLSQDIQNTDDTVMTMGGVYVDPAKQADFEQEVSSSFPAFIKVKLRGEKEINLLDQWRKRTGETANVLFYGIGSTQKLQGADLNGAENIIKNLNRTYDPRGELYHGARGSDMSWDQIEKAAGRKA